MACLVDSCEINDGWQGGNRKAYSSGAGHSVTQSVYWNSTGTGGIGSWNYGEGYVIDTSVGIGVNTGFHFLGYDDGTNPVDYTEGLGQASSLSPQSLFEDQFIKRTTNDVNSGVWIQYE